ncbi:MAG: hypothetical protein HP496_11160 [Nitrospira sp.]|nr:hypothetical protein [Nitrospira sp.]
MLSPCQGWVLSLTLLMGLSACGQASSDPGMEVESHARLGGVSVSIPVSAPGLNHDLAPISDPREARVPQPDRSSMSEQTNPSVDASEPPGVFPMMNVWTQEGIPMSVVALENSIDDASLEEDANAERRNWDLAHETERLEDETEQGERAGERNE